MNIEDIQKENDDFKIKKRNILSINDMDDSESEEDAIAKSLSKYSFLPCSGTMSTPPLYGFNFTVCSG